MKTIFTGKFLILTAGAAVAVAAGYSAIQSPTGTNSTAISANPATPTEIQSQAASAPPPTPALPTLPQKVLPNSPLAQVVRLAQAGLDQSILMAYVTNSASTFNLDSEKIIY